MEATESKEKDVIKRNYGKIILTLENAILPSEKLESITVSQEDGLSRDIELDLRILGCELIQTAGILLKLPQVCDTGSDFRKYLKFISHTRAILWDYLGISIHNAHFTSM